MDTRGMKKPAALQSQGQALIQEEIQAGLAGILAELIRRYTAGDGSSVREETAADILGSVCYALDAFASENHCSLLDALNQKGVRSAYEEGVETLRACLAQTKALYHEVASKRLTLPLAPYNDLLDHAIPEFLASYDIEFHAQDTACSIDYPLVFDDMGRQGVLYIRQYLETLRLETEFCRVFPQKSVLRVLYGYQAKFGVDIADTPLNLFELLYDQMAFTALAGGEVDGLAVSPVQYEEMERMFARMDQRSVMASLARATRKSAAALGITDPALLGYMRRYRRQLAGRLISAVSHGSLQNMVLVSGQGGRGASFTDGARMGDHAFTRLIERVAESKTAGKLRLIAENVRSVHDYIDLLEADCLFGDEYKTLYNILGDVELAVLGRVFLGGGPGMGRLSLTSGELARYRGEAGQQWQAQWLDFISKLSGSRREEIERLMGSLTIDYPDDGEQ